MNKDVNYITNKHQVDELSIVNQLSLELKDELFNNENVSIVNSNQIYSQMRSERENIEHPDFVNKSMVSFGPYIFDIKNLQNNEENNNDLNQLPFDFSTIIENDSLSTREYYNYKNINNNSQSLIKYYDLENKILQKINNHINYIEDINRIESEYNDKIKILNEQLEKKKNELSTRKKITDELDFVEIEIFRRAVFKLVGELKNLNLVLDNLKISYNIHENQCNENKISETINKTTVNRIRNEYRNKIKEYFHYLKGESLKISKIVQECMILNGFIFIVSKNDFMEMEKIILFNKNIKLD